MKAIAISFLPMVLAVTVCAQSTFKNLNFEAAQLVPIPGDPYGPVQFSSAFPGWTGYYGSQQVTSTVPNGLPLSFNHGPFIVLCAPPECLSMQGSYMVCLSGGYGYDPSTNWTPASMVQTGVISGNVRSIRLLTNQPNSPGAGRNLVFLNGVEIPLLYLESATNYGNVWVGDVTAFAGRYTELRLSGGWTYYDDIRFSYSPIPEPSSFSVLLGGVAVILGIRFVAQKTAHERPNEPASSLAIDDDSTT